MKDFAVQEKKLTARTTTHRHVVINDTTLRDGEQSPGVAFTADEKLDIAVSLQAAGVDEIEVGIPMMGGKEREVIRAITQLLTTTQSMAWCRMHPNDLSACRHLTVDWLDLSLPASSQQRGSKLGVSLPALLEQSTTVIRDAIQMGFRVCVGMEDASRAAPETLIQIAEMAQTMGAERLRFADTVGILDPFSTYEAIKFLVERSDLQIEMHAHDDLGMATANTYAAIQAGAYSVNTTLNGLGERAGNAPLEEVVATLNALQGNTMSPVQDESRKTFVDLAKLPELCQKVAHYSRRPNPANKPVVGDVVFTHESGIHVDGLIKNMENYQGLKPHLVGREHEMVLGKHSGCQAIQTVSKQWGMELSPRSLLPIKALLRRWAEENKRIVERADFVTIIDSL
ncbi:homocitrate synthase [Photobacterium sp. ZSDE20]|uniref:Homocitrate synthase n=1 Tax=Photobacterium pectinilyticum TaxID=2906793 RepID=A0ABT1N1G0_9GAMM|nr:homocitrate synthase [Photobacterium sp. ZSDE20]MCQ1058575.1 homocitrate synthase [Photobacterium sp. ZSDE20]MDD1826304.1 homocitrate synthase [Photobacterium sp. ZSDE20]